MWRQLVACGALTMLCTGATLAGDSAPRSMAYVLQADKLANDRAAAVAMLSGCDRDLIVIDAWFETGSDDGRWTRDEIARIRGGRPGRRVVAYLSIGEAEDYRPYWQRAWDRNRDGHPDPGAPSFLCSENPDWHGNYRVRYWDPAWQTLVLNDLDAIGARGFDGVYLDIVDAYETFEYDPAKHDWTENRSNPATGHTYRADMIDWVRRIAARTRTSCPGFWVIPQNALALAGDPAYADIINAAGAEDVFAEGNRMKSSTDVEETLRAARAFRAAGKPVFAIEYAKSAGTRAKVEAAATAAGLPVLFTDRQLTGLGQFRPASP